ncbi:MAG TPA: DNA methyltransferase, partial [Patescibacteria group bacterium]|nr:DNA methyltransferase [Patescibacteria group bacterium]
HYTSEKNIMKVIGPLFLDDLKAEFESVKNSTAKLKDFHRKLASLKFLDPACGCGNFLIIAYREIREIELNVLRILLKKKDTLLLDIAPEIHCNVDQFYGIEIEEFPAQIARTAMWLMDHQMNMKVGNEFGRYVARLPLTKKATIVHGNALEIDWADVVKPTELNYIFGNPPFVGKQMQTSGQKAEMAKVFFAVKGAGVLDFVAAWYIKAAKLIQSRASISCAFVSTNSITQGEQVGVLWRELFRLGVVVNFAHRTFNWTNEAKGKAAVHCVIIGFSNSSKTKKTIFDYARPDADPHGYPATNINPYLVDAPNLVLMRRSEPLTRQRPLLYGNKPVDAGHLIFDEAEKNQLLEGEPAARKFFRRFIGAEEFLYNIPRYCLWLECASPAEIKSMPAVLHRLEQVRLFRKSSQKHATRQTADTPMLFAEIRQPKKNYLAIPEVSSERRDYLPVGYISPDVISSNLLYAMDGATIYDLGIMSSSMHMAWVRAVCGRLESRYRYSAGIVYNNFPWPEPTKEQKAAIEKAAQGVLDARDNHKGASLADLYDPNTMPPDLVKAHRMLDAAVDAAYSKKKFSGDSDRVAFLFALYQKLAAPLDAATPKKPRRKKQPV